jgi:hypothetical protein
MAQQKSEDRVVRAGLAVLLAGGSPVGPTPSGVRSQEAGVMPRRAQEDEGSEVLVDRYECAGQGARREVGSEGFAANRRAVAELNGEPVGQIQVIPSLHYGGEGSTWGAWTQQGVCGRHGGKATRVTPGGLVRSRPTGLDRAYKPDGEVAGDAVREVGVAHGTQEPGKSKSPGIAPRGATGRRPKRRRPGGRGHAGQGDSAGGSGE